MMLSPKPHPFPRHPRPLIERLRLAFFQRAFAALVATLSGETKFGIGCWRQRKFPATSITRAGNTVGTLARVSYTSGGTTLRNLPSTKYALPIYSKPYVTL